MPQDSRKALKSTQHAVNKKALKQAEQWVLVVSKQSYYHRQQDKVLNRDSRAWRLGVKVTNYQDKDEVLSKSLES